MEIREVPERNTLVVRVTTPVAELPGLMGRVFGEVAGFMQRKSIPFAGMPFALYHNMDMSNLDVIRYEGLVGISQLVGAFKKMSDES